MTDQPDRQTKPYKEDRMELGRVKAHTGTVHVGHVKNSEVIGIACGAGSMHGTRNRQVTVTQDKVTCERCRSRYRPEILGD
jgi:hypothetical protein